MEASLATSEQSTCKLPMVGSISFFGAVNNHQQNRCLFATGIFTLKVLSTSLLDRLKISLPVGLHGAGVVEPSMIFRSWSTFPGNGVPERSRNLAKWIAGLPGAGVQGIALRLRSWITDGGNGSMLANAADDYNVWHTAKTATIKQGSQIYGRPNVLFNYEQKTTTRFAHLEHNACHWSGPGVCLYIYIHTWLNLWSADMFLFGTKPCAALPVLRIFCFCCHILQGKIIGLELPVYHPLVQIQKYIMHMNRKWCK